MQVLVQYESGVKKYKLVTCGDDMTCSMTKPKKKRSTRKSLLESQMAKFRSRKTNRSNSSGDSKRFTNFSDNLSQRSTLSSDLQIETHFIKVCEFTEGAIFNMGENISRRRVVSDSSTNCLLIPRYWLMKMNKDNIWNRVIQFLNKTIPSTRNIFDEWIKEKKFVAYRKKFVQDILAGKRISNTNCIHNVPYSIRLKECVE